MRKLIERFASLVKADNIKAEDLDQDQLAKLLGAIDKNDHPSAGPMMKLALFTGLGRGELCRLEWRNLDFQRRFITIRGPKSGKDQIIPMNDAAYGLLTVRTVTIAPMCFPTPRGSGGSTSPRRSTVTWRPSEDAMPICSRKGGDRENRT